jgi:hypothetical protein
MSSRQSPISPGKGSPRRSSSARRSAERKRRRTSSQKRSDDRWLEQRMDRAMPEAEVEVFSMAVIPPRTPRGRLSVFRPTMGVSLREIGEDDLIGDFDDAAVAELLMSGSPRVLAVAKKNRSMGTRISRSLGKMVGLIPSNRMSTQKGLDVDMDKFEGTCLDGIALSDGEIGLLKHIFQDDRKGSHIFMLNMRKYCRMRDALLTKDPSFENKYPNLYYVSLKLICSLAENDENVELFLNRLPSYSVDSLIHSNEQSGIDNDVEDQIMLLNRILYDGGPGESYLSKPDGVGRGKKSRKNKRTKKLKKMKTKKRRTKQHIVKYKKKKK